MGAYDLKDNIGNTITRSDIYRVGSEVLSKLQVVQVMKIIIVL